MPKILPNFPLSLLILSVVIFTRRSCFAIVNGTVIDIKDASWMVALIHESTGDLICTAFLIELDWAITAARCLDNLDGPFDVLYVLAGIGSLDSRTAADKAYVASWYKHPCYVEKNSYDIALLELSSKLDAGKASKLTLSGAPWPEDNLAIQKCDTLGWGSSGETGIGNIDILRKTTIETTHGSSSCLCTMRFDQKRLACSTIGGAALCMKDFGGPLICNGKAVGIAHHLISTTCNDYNELECQDESVFSSYIFICPYLSWIKKYVPSVPDKPASCLSPMHFPSVISWCVTMFVYFNIKIY